MAKKAGRAIWKLKKGQDKRIRAGHPWVMDHEIANPISGHKPGFPVELQDFEGKFLARGYGNPKSKISFRALSFDPQDFDPLSGPRLLEKVLEAWAKRKEMGYRGSFRMVFSEGDQLSGLIVDYYTGKSNGNLVQIFATQVLTAGMELAMGPSENFFKMLTEAGLEKGLSQIAWSETAVVLRNDVRSRKHEDLDVDPPRFVKSVRESDFTRFPILLNAADGDGLIEMDCDLFQGQKTGFFLDQTENIRVVMAAISGHKFGKTVRILDLCCYVGHWSAQLAHALRKKGYDVECTLADVSARALDFAKTNVERAGGKAIVANGDMFKTMSGLDRVFDIVIADPPAFIKSKKDIPIGKHAYLKMNTAASKLTKTNGFLVSCTCSGLLPEKDFTETVQKALGRTGAGEAKLLAEGKPAPDHPGIPGFDEGVYLKMMLHQMPATIAEPPARYIKESTTEEN